MLTNVRHSYSKEGVFYLKMFHKRFLHMKGNKRDNPDTQDITYMSVVLKSG